MNGILGDDSALVELYFAGATWTNETNYVMNHAAGAGLIARPGNPSALPLYHRCPLCELNSWKLYILFNGMFIFLIVRNTVIILESSVYDNKR